MIYNEELIESFVTLQKLLIKENPGLTEICVAGGAVRDMLLGKPIKDIDVFIRGTINEDWFEANCMSKSKPYGNITETRVWSLDNEIPVDIIWNDKYMGEVVGNFPCTLSRVLIDHHGGMTISKEFRYAVANELLIFTDDCPEEYKQRMHAKYDNYI